MLVVDGGITGCTVAPLLAESGRSVENVSVIKAFVQDDLTHRQPAPGS